MQTDDTRSTLKESANAALWLLAGVIVYLSFGYTEMQGSDLWWHIAAGREIVQTGSLWLTDSWSFTADGAVWRNHAWLSDLVFYAWVSLLGMETLVYWKWLVLVATFVLVQRQATRTSGEVIAGFVLAVVAVAVAAPFLDVRPQLYTFFFFALLPGLLTARTTPLWQLALVFLVWSNLHGGYVFGLLSLAVYVFPYTDFSMARVLRAATTVAVCTLACMLNPDGPMSLLLPLTYALQPDSPYRQLGEWLPPFAPGGIQAPLYIYLLALPALCALAYCWPRLRRESAIQWAPVVLCAVTLVMSLTSRRFIPLFAIATALMAAPAVGWVLRQTSITAVQPYLALVALAAGVLRMQPYPLAAAPAYHYLTSEYTYPIDTLNFVEANQLRGKVFNYYNWGGYLHWRTDGRMRSFIDGRANTVYGDAEFLDYVRVLSHRPDWQQVIERSGADFVLWPYAAFGTQTYQALSASGRWQMLYQDSVGFLMVRTGTDIPEQLVNAPPGVWQTVAEAQLSSFKNDQVRAAALSLEALQRMPYNLTACNIRTVGLAKTGQMDAARNNAAACDRQFPSQSLKRPPGPEPT